MNKIGKHVRNIYRAPEEKETDYSRPSGRSPEIEEDIRKHHQMSVISGIMAVGVVVVLAFLIAQSLRDNPSLSPAEQAEPEQEYVPYNSLPLEELWVMNYELVADRALLDSEEGVSFSTKWLKYAAYHVILGQQALSFENAEKAVFHFEKALEILPELKDVQEPLGTAYLRANRPVEAVRHLEKALLEEDHFTTRSNLGIAYMQSGNLEKAEETLLAALEQRPEHPGAHKNLALLYREKDEPEKAIRFFENYLSINLDDLLSAELFVEYLIEQGQVETAVAFLGKQSAKSTDQSLPLLLLLAGIQAQSTNAPAAILTLQSVTQYLSPNLILTELNGEVFDPIRNEESFERFVQQLELAAITLEDTP